LLAAQRDVADLTKTKESLEKESEIAESKIQKLEQEARNAKDSREAAKKQEEACRNGLLKANAELKQAEEALDAARIKDAEIAELKKQLASRSSSVFATSS
jgi:predicted  nucleic acid-binding Zn-ribbon protein